jgi:hypothetical protein
MLTEADATHPAAEVVGDGVQHEPGGIGGKVSRWQVVQADAVLEVADHVLDDDVTTVIGLEILSHYETFAPRRAM